ncbi:MAG TPA: di-heme oxidoredictase family protein [Gemmataceae bacterium]|nr:di-heme oxidoredictase family protein [Gemmataceae bacterium]
MKKRLGTVALAAGAAASVLICWTLHALAQLDERPGTSLDNPIDFPRDLSGCSIKNPRVRIVHTTTPGKAGGSMYLQMVDPWLGYKWGWSLIQREFRERDGVYGDAGKLDGIILPDGATKMMSRGHVNSCAICHNTPYRDGGAGATIPKNGGEGRNTPHMFGAGLVEMIGLQMRLQALALADANRDGWISLAEAKGKRCILYNLPEGIPGERVAIDYGSFEDKDGDGKPDLNPLFHPIYVDKDGHRIPFARDLKFPGVAGYTFEVQCFGFGHLHAPFRPPVSTTIRSFISTPFDIHSGLQAFDPTTLNETHPTGLAEVSNAGAQQFVTAAGKDRGAVRGPTGVSKDDPDRDGYCEEISEGDLDVAEWYLLNHPAPARGEITEGARRGEKLFHQVGCAACHVPDWHLHAHNPKAKDYTQRYDGDRRFFELQVAWNDKTERLEGKLVHLADRKGELWVPRRKAYTVRGFYSDLKYHDLGEAFYQMQFDGTIVKQWRTAPLWGVGSTAPYGHDGASLTLDDVIRRHGGEALKSRQAYTALKRPERRDVIEFLESLVLYQTERIPCDLDGDGRISEHFRVAGMDTGLERFNPEWLFRVPGKIEGPCENVKGEKIISFALTNVREAYGLRLEYLKDSDGDGFPDVIDPKPFKRGYRDGEN